MVLYMYIVDHLGLTPADDSASTGAAVAEWLRCPPLPDHYPLTLRLRFERHVEKLSVTCHGSVVFLMDLLVFLHL